jgi:MFS transporter, MHS family, proline/betaine transporter
LAEVTATTQAVVQEIDLRKSRRALVAGALGNLVEWYEFALYGYLAPVISRQFFPGTDDAASLLATLSVFALAFFARPIGAVLFGRIGDRLGRKPQLVLIISIMMIATTAIGLLPTYATIGVWAPLLLVIIRLSQGLSAGGEVGGAVSLMVESAPPRRRGLYGSWSFMTTSLGFVIGGGTATILTMVLSADAMTAWGWRVGFLLSLPMGLVIMYLRSRVDETPAYKKVLAEREIAALNGADAGTGRPNSRWLRSGIITLGVVVVYNCIGNTFMVGMPSYLTSAQHMTLQNSYLLTVLTGVTAVIVMPFAGALSDRIGRKPVILTGTIAVVVLSYPLFALLEVNMVWASISLIVAGACIGVVGGPVPALLAERFPTRNRATGVAVSYSLSVAVFGGTAPFIINWLSSATADPRSAAYYTAICGAISLIAVLALPRRSKVHLEPLQD